MLKKIAVSVGFAVLLSPVTAWAKCATVQECAQEAVEAAMTARAQVDLSVPPGAVMAFALEKCPQPYWEEYEPAYGRFVRGIDRSGREIDPEGPRPAGNTQGDTIKKHNHSYEQRSTGHLTAAEGGGGVGDLHQFHYGTASQETTPAGLAETRPKNVALLYCIRK